MEERRFIRLFLLVPTLLVLYFVYRIFRPFLMPIVLAGILASLCHPLFRWASHRLPGREGLAAFLTCLGVTAVVIVPCVSLVLLLAQEAAQVYQKVQAATQDQALTALLDVRRQPYLGSLIEYLGQYVDLTQIDLMARLTQSLEAISVFFIRQSTAIVSGVAHLLTSFLVMMVTLFFLFKDGSSLVQQLKTWTPLSHRYEELIISKFQEVTSATVLGTLLTALAQGVAGGILFWLLSIPNVVLWGSLMALFSLVPLVGTAIVWMPWVIYLAATGAHVRALLLALAAIFFVGMIDNILRPLLIEGKTRMHTLLVFFSIMGGIGYFGILGMILGPIVVALGLTFVELYKIEYQAELARPADGEAVSAEE